MFITFLKSLICFRNWQSSILAFILRVTEYQEEQTTINSSLVIYVSLFFKTKEMVFSLKEIYDTILAAYTIHYGIRFHVFTMK